MNTHVCSACRGRLHNLGRIPDGILFKCVDCGSKKIFIEKYQSKKDNKGYGKSYREHMNDTKIVDIKRLFEMNYPQSNTKSKLLDIGFGNGEFLAALDKKNLDISGLECDINAVSILEQKGIRAYYGELGGELNIDTKFNLVTLWDVLEHIDDVEKAISQLSVIIKRGGKLFILTPNAGSLFDILADIERHLTFFKSHRIMSICLNRYHLHRFSEKGLETLLDRFGFAADKIETIQNFSLKPDEYTDGFAPGIMKWTGSSSLNKELSNYAIKIIRTLKIRNKIFVTAVRR